MSATFDEKLVSANSPPEPPKPVKSNRSTANPLAAKRELSKVLRDRYEDGIAALDDPDLADQ